jgi:Family of unknown function (DUF6131)
LGAGHDCSRDHPVAHRLSREGRAIIWTVGIIVLIIGAVLAIAGRAGHAISGRKHWY